MSHATLVNDGLLLLTIASALLLMTFVSAVIRVPSERADRPAQPAGDTGQSGGTGYRPRHAAPGAPPWGPAPKPPGIDRDGA